MQIPKIKASIIASKMNNNETFQKLSGYINIEFDDGVIKQIHSNVVKFSSVYWRVCIKYGLLINSKMCFSDRFKSITETSFSTGGGKKIAEQIFRAYRDTHPDVSEDWRVNCYKLSRDLAVASNDIYNLASEYAAAYVTTVNIGDFVEIATDPELVQKKEELKAKLPTMSHNAVKIATDEIISFGEKLIKTKHKDNPISNAVDSGLMKQNQLNQVVILRGVVSDVDRSEFRKPILDSYTDGITNLADSHAEIKTAAASVEASKSDLEDAEYANRMIQQVAMFLENSHSVDCGSTYTMPMIVRDEQELKDLEGTYFIKAIGAIPTRIRSDMKELIGTTINRRSVLAGCLHPDENGACVVCSGDLLQWAPKGANVGHWITAPFGAKMTQGILSKKHYSGSAEALTPQIGEVFNNWFTFDKEVENILYKKKKINGNVSIIFSVKEVHGLSTVFGDTSTTALASSTVASLTTVVIQITNNDRTVSETVPVSDSNRKPSFTSTFIDYIRSKPERLTIKDGKMVIVNIDEWDSKEPMFSVPMKSVDMAIFQKQVKSILHTAGGNRIRNKTAAPLEVLGVLYDTVKDRFNVNYSVLECMLYTYCAKNPKIGDYRMPKGGDEFHLLTGNTIIQNRSLGATAAFQGMSNLLLRPQTFTRFNRVSSPFDYMMVPHLASQSVDARMSGQYK